MNAPTYINNAHKALSRNPGGLTLEELSGKLRAKAPKVSQQIRELHDAGLIETTEDAGQPVYKLKAAPAAKSGRADIPPPQYDPASVAFPSSVVTNNPHTGTPRNPLDIESDPKGLLIVKDGEPLKAASKAERVLTPEAQDDRDDFEAQYGDNGDCSCHVSAPCGSCMHPGNPMQQENNDACWMAAGDSEGGETDAPAVDAQREEFTLLGLIADIRAAAGDPDGRLMQDELVQHIAGVVKERDILKAENLALKTLEGSMPGFGAEFEASRKHREEMSRVIAELQALRTSHTNAINEADRLRAELATERQAREALQEQSGVIQAKGYIVCVPGIEPRVLKKHERARREAERLARQEGMRVDVFALVPAGSARMTSGVQWRDA